MSQKNKIAIIMSVRNEESIIDMNIAYHLDLAFDYIFITNHCSTDGTNEILKSYKDNPKIIVLQETSPVFDHAKITNKAIKFANKHYKIDWFIFLDADEFLDVKDKNIHNFIDRLNKKDISYATIGWANALFDQTLFDYRCSAVNHIDTTKYFYPWPEKKWQEYGHFRKTIVKNHSYIEAVVGGHYVRSENNASFFGDYNKNPFIIPEDQARLLHYEFRDKAEILYEKWQKLAQFENDSTSPKNSPWLERIETIKRYVKKYKNNIKAIETHWFFEHRSFWGTLIPQSRILYCNSMSIWYRSYFRRIVENKKIKSVCLVRSGHLGDIIMSEPIAKFLKQYVPRVCLATKMNSEKIKSILATYDDVYTYDQTESLDAIDCDIFIKLVYELSDKNKNYIQGYMESIGFGEIKNKILPDLRDKWPKIVKGEYIVIAPLISNWEKQKRGWGYDKFMALSSLLREKYKIKFILLNEKYTFEEMMSLIRHCKFFIGNDSGPAIIAQSFKKKSFVIFGATHPKYIKLSNLMIPIYDKNRHKLCQHQTRQEEIECSEDFCMERLSVDKVFNLIKLKL